MSGVLDSRLGYLILFAFAILLYANTLNHDFVLDDEVVILKNNYVQKGIEGVKEILTHDSFAGFARIGEGESLLVGGRYRPLSLVIFSFFEDLFGNNPLPFHFFNILLYAGCGIMVFYFLKQILYNEASGTLMAFITTLLFVAHPIHTEVVANIKSLDELLVLFFGIAALIALFKSYDARSFFWSIISFASIVMACLAKENAVSLILIGPLFLWFFRKSSIPKQWKYYLPILLGGILFLFVRMVVLGKMPEGRLMTDPLNNPFLEWTGSAWIACSEATQAATVMYTMGDYLRLLIFPFPLTHDYYPFHIELQSFTNPKVIISFLAMTGLTGLAIHGLFKHRKYSAGIWFFLITGSLTFNIFFPVGVFMAERFLFLPSLGLILAVVLWSVPWVAERHSLAGTIFLIAVILLFSILTVKRNQAWKDNEALMQTDVHTSANSAKIRNHLGTLLLDKALLQQDTVKRMELLKEAIVHLEKAVELHPNYFDALLANGACHYYLRDYEQSVEDYRAAVQYYAKDEQSSLGLSYALLAYGKKQWENGDSIEAIQSLQEAWRIRPDAENAHQISTYYLEMNQSEKALEWTTKASSTEN